MSSITTHILDTSRGKPANDVGVTLELMGEEGNWKVLGRGRTNQDGRVGDLLAPDSKLRPATYRLRFAITTYFDEHGLETFYPEIVVTFRIEAPAEHYHVPLLISPFGYSTHRGS